MINPVITHKCDVLVIGAGLEGCIAALETARAGKKVLLAENSGSLGQAAANGLYIHLPEESNLSEEINSYREYFLKQAGNKNNDKKMIYHDQMMKTVLRKMLDDAGVQVLTHVFVCGGEVEEQTVSVFRLCGKTGYIDVEAETLIDATDKMEAGAALGLQSKAVLGEIRTNVKCNRVKTQAIRNLADEITEEGDGYLIGIVKYPLEKTYKGITCTSVNLTLYHDMESQELIIGPITAKIGTIDTAALSAAQAGLRMFAYNLRDELRKNAAGFEKLNIIHVASRTECYGMRRILYNPYDNLFLINNEVTKYSNLKAIALGIQTAKEILEGGGQNAAGL